MLLDSDPQPWGIRTKPTSCSSVDTRHGGGRCKHLVVINTRALANPIAASRDFAGTTLLLSSDFHGYTHMAENTPQHSRVQ